MRVASMVAACICASACGSAGLAARPSAAVRPGADPLAAPARRVASRAAPWSRLPVATARRGPRTVNVAAARSPCERVVQCCPHFLRELGRADAAPVACTLMAHFLREFHEDDDSCRDSLADMRRSLVLARRPTPGLCAASP